MKSDTKAAYDAALLKRQQLEQEIDRCGATSAEKANMAHSLSKLWLYVGDMRDAGERAAARAERKGERTT